MSATNPLSQQTCVACRRGEPTLTPAQIESLQPQVPDWQVVVEDNIPRLRRAFAFKDFAGALAFTQHVGQAAEQQGHHPLLLTEWGQVTVTWWSHKIEGLHQNDFIMAAKTDELYAA